MVEIATAAAEEVPFLKKFSINWAAGRLLQSHLAGARSYRSAIADPESYMYNKRVATTKIGAREHEEAMDEGRFENGPLVKRKRANHHYCRPNKFVSVKQEVISDVDLSGSDSEAPEKKKKKKSSKSNKESSQKKAGVKDKQAKSSNPKPKRSKGIERKAVPVSSDKYGPAPVKVTYGKGNAIPVPGAGTSEVAAEVGSGEEEGGEKYLVELEDNGKSSEEEASSSEEEESGGSESGGESSTEDDD